MMTREEYQTYLRTAPTKDIIQFSYLRFGRMERDWPSRKEVLFMVDALKELNKRVDEEE